MTGFEVPVEFGETVWELIKLVVLFCLLLYLGFAVVVIREVQLMTRTVAGKLDSAISIISWIHFVLAIGIFLAALIML